MLAANSGSSGGSVAGANNADGDANGGPSREQEMMMLYNAQVMGTMAATDINVPDVVMADAAADGLFMA